MKVRFKKDVKSPFVSDYEKVIKKDTIGDVSQEWAEELFKDKSAVPVIRYDGVYKDIIETRKKDKE